MDAINIYKSATYTQNTFNTIGSIGSVEDSKKDQTDDNKIAIATDSVEITQKNDNIINSKKANDAFNETNTQYETGDGQFPPAFYFIMIRSMMQDRGISVPDFTLDGKNPENSNFVGFVDKLKDFTKSLSIKDEQFNDLPSNFFEFCDTYKENLIKNGCN